MPWLKFQIFKSNSILFFFFWEFLLKGSLSKLHFLILFNLLVESLGIKELMPAYLDPHLQPQDLPTGVSFASGGSGYDPLTSKLAVHEHLCHFLSSVLFYYFKTLVRFFRYYNLSFPINWNTKLYWPKNHWLNLWFLKEFNVIYVVLVNTIIRFNLVKNY